MSRVSLAFPREEDFALDFLPAIVALAIVPCPNPDDGELLITDFKRETCHDRNMPIAAQRVPLMNTVTDFLRQEGLEIVIKDFATALSQLLGRY